MVSAGRWRSARHPKAERRQRHQAPRALRPPRHSRAGSQRPSPRGRNYRLHVGADPEARIWLPNAFVDGAVGETPPIRILQQVGDIRTALLLLRLYRNLDMVGAGGVDPDLLHQSWRAPRIIDHCGGYTLYAVGDGPERIHVHQAADEYGIDARRQLFDTGLLRWATHVRTKGDDGMDLGPMDWATHDKAEKMWHDSHGSAVSIPERLVAIRSHIREPIVVDIAQPLYLPMTRPVIYWHDSIRTDTGNPYSTIAR